MSESLYTQFAELDPERMDALGAAEERRAGHRLYEAERFGGLTWVAPGRHLKATCDKRQVEFAAKDGALLGKCACGGSLAEGACRHLYALLFAICNLLDDERYRVLFRNNKFRDHLKRVYWSAQGEMRNPGSTGAHPELRLYFDEQGFFTLRLPASWHEAARRKGRDEQDPLFRLAHLESRGPEGQQALIRYLCHTEAKVPLSVHLPERSYANLRWQGDVPIRVQPMLALTDGGNVVARYEIQTAGGSAKRLLLPPHLAMAPDAGAVMPMEGHIDLNALFPSGSASSPRWTRDRMSVAAFHAGAAAVEGKNRNQAQASLTVRAADGAEGSQALPARICVVLNPSNEDDTILYIPQVFDHAETEALPAAVRFAEALRPFRSPPSCLRNASERRALWQLVDAFFLEQDGDGLQARRQAILEQGDFPAEHCHRINQLLESFQQRVLDRRCYLLRVRAGRWFDVEAPHRALGFALAVGRRVLRGVPHGSDQDLALRVPAARVKEQLGAVVEALSAHGIEVRMHGRPVQKARVDVCLTQRVTQDIDWFELHPSVSIEGRELSREEWTHTLRGGALETEAGLAVLGGNDRDVLRRLTSLLPDAGGTGESGRVRRLEILEWLELESNGVRLDVDPSLRDTLDRLRSFDRMDEAPVPRGLQAPLRPYQRMGYRWLAFLYRHRFGACLADDMGLGKTIQTIALLSGIHEAAIPRQHPALKGRPHLVVVPASLVFNWEEELARFAPDLRVARYTGPERSADFDGADVVLTTYGILARDLDRLRDICFHVLVFDEAQALKNLRAARSEAARTLRAAFIVCLTGTPLENHIGEYYAILDLALPGMLGSYSAFMQSAQDPESTPALRRARPFVLRRTKAEILMELPPKTEQTIHLDLSEKQREAYTQTIAEVRQTVSEAYAAYTPSRAGVIALSALVRLRQICISPALVDAGTDADSPKVEFLLNQLQALRDEGHAALIFSQFTRCLDLLDQSLEREGIERLRLDGSTPTSKRKQLVNRFQSGEGPSLFLLSLKSGGTGLNLTRASYVFHMDPWWNPAAESQATDRTHRLGQTQPVLSTRLIMRHTVEEKMEILKRRKAAVFQTVLAGGKGATQGGAITREDVQFLLDESFGAQTMR